MALRSSWKGYFKLSLVSVPVKAYSAISVHEGEIHFHQLHDKCHSRIKYAKTCPKHGVVPADEIVSGYEYAKGQYVVIDQGELEQLRGDSEKSVSVEAIVPDGSIDALYFTERTSYLIPDGRVGQKAYSLIEQCMRDQKVVAMARLTLNGKDDVVMIRPRDGLMMMTVLNASAQVYEPQSFADEVVKASVSAAEMKLTKTLFDAFRQEEVDLADYKNRYTERLAELIEAKVKGQEIVVPERADEPDVINLMDALKKSVAFAKSIPARKPTALAEKKIPKTSRTKIAAKQKSKTA